VPAATDTPAGDPTPAIAGVETVATDGPPHSRRLGHPFTGAAVGLASGAVAFGWAWLWLRQEVVAWTESSGVPLEVPTELAADFGVLTGSLALLAWLVGARTHLRPRRAVVVVAAVVLAWTIAGYLLFAAGAFPAWPAFEGPFVMVDGFDFVVRPTWTSLAGPLAVLALTALAAWVGAHFRDRRAPAAPASAWGHGVVAVAAAVGVGAYVGLQVLVWPREVLGAWPASELLGWPFAGLTVAVAVAWATSGRGRATVTLNVVAALALLVYASGTTVDSVVMVGLGVVTVAVAAAHRPFARTLQGLLA